nr:hypothetical protein CFP56_22330 [Quercus suber]
MRPSRCAGSDRCTVELAAHEMAGPKPLWAAATAAHDFPADTMLSVEVSVSDSKPKSVFQNMTSSSLLLSTPPPPVHNLRRPAAERMNTLLYSVTKVYPEWHDPELSFGYVAWQVLKLVATRIPFPFSSWAIGIVYGSSFTVASSYHKLSWLTPADCRSSGSQKIRSTWPLPTG